MFNNIFKYGKNRKNNKDIIIGLLILVIGIFLATDILKNTSLFKFREGWFGHSHLASRYHLHNQYSQEDHEHDNIQENNNVINENKKVVNENKNVINEHIDNDNVHIEDGDDVYIDCNPVDSKGESLVVISNDSSNSMGLSKTTITTASIVKDRGAQFAIGLIVLFIVYNVAQKGFKAISKTTEGHDRLFGGSLNKLN